MSYLLRPLSGALIIPVVVPFLASGLSAGLAASESEATDRGWKPSSRSLAGSDLRKDKRKAIRAGDWVASFGGSAQLGYSDNVHAAPEEALGQTDLPKDSPFLAGQVYGRLEKSFFDSDRFDIGAEVQTITYFDESDADSLTGELDLDWDIDISDAVTWRNDARIKITDDSSTNIFGDPFIRDFGSTRYEVGTGLDIKAGDRHKFYLGYVHTIKDYNETDGLNSIDWAEHALQARYRLKASDSLSLRLWSEFALQEYDEELANSVSDGRERPENPEEEHDHLNLLGWLSWDATESLSLEVKGKYKAKEDQFEDYETYDELGIEFGIEWWLGEDWLLQAEAGTATRDFDHRPASNTSGGLLSYDKVEFNADLWYVLNSNAAIFFGYAYTDRDSNRDFGTVYRDYTINVVSGGVSLSY